MIISDTAVKNRVSVVILALIILIVGIYSYNVIPRESIPDIDVPYVFILTNYRGVASADIESSITIPIENKLKGLDGVKVIRSSSAEGKSSIMVEFIPETDINDALQKVKDKVDTAKGELPGDLEDDPSVFEVNFSEMPIVVYSLSGTAGLVALKEIADNLEEEIEGIPGVLEVNVSGGRTRSILVEVDADKLAYYRIPITTFYNVINSENSNTSGGVITLGDGRYQLRVPGEFDTPDELYGLVITTFKGKPVYLKDLASVVDGFKEEKSRSRLNGRKAVNISVKKRSGENIVALSAQIDKIVEENRPSWPVGTNITKLMDHAKMVQLMVSDLENNILSGLLLVIVVLLFALGFRNSVLVALAIPFSMFISFMILNALGITLNMVVLFSLTLALGMLVDNAIVIVENIYRYMEQGVPRVQAAMKGTSEVAYPVIGSTLTTVAAFFPMIFWPGIMGEFMSYLPQTVIITLSSSLFVAMVINPALASIFLRVKDRGKKSNEARTAEEIAAAGEKPIVIQGRVLKLYSRLLGFALRHRLKVLFSSFALLVILLQIWLLVIGIEKPIEFFPSTDPNSVYVNITPPEGADLDYLDRLVKKVEMAVNTSAENTTESGLRDLAEYEGSYVPKKHKKVSGEEFQGPSDLGNVEHIYAVSASKSGSSIFSSTSDNHLGIQFLDLKDRLSKSTSTLEELRRRVVNIPGAKILVEVEENGPPTGPPINIEISGDDFHLLGDISKRMREKIAKIPYIEDLHDDFVSEIPSIMIKIDRQKAALYGLSTSSIGFALKTAYNGMDVSTYRVDGEDYDITVTLDEEDKKVTDILYKLMIPTPTGQVVPLTTLATISYAGSFGEISRIDHKRVVTISANVDETKIPSSVLRMQAKELLDNYDLPPGYNMEFTGEDDMQKESQDFLSKAFLVAIFLIFLILVTIFNSVIQPVIIMTSVVLSLGGVFLGLTIIKAPFGVIMTGVGVISLAGIVVNNAIVLIDYTNRLRNSGMAISNAIVSAGATRLRPVILTAITTILGLLPMVTGISYDFRALSISMVSESSQMWQSMAIVVIFGLIIATFLTLVVVPVLYSLLTDLPENIRDYFNRIKQMYWRVGERLIGSA